jgi:hypothetical protein
MVSDWIVCPAVAGSSSIISLVLLLEWTLPFSDETEAKFGTPVTSQCALIRKLSEV